MTAVITVNYEDDVMDLMHDYHLPEIASTPEQIANHWTKLGEEFQSFQNYGAAMECYDNATRLISNIDVISSLLSSRAYAYIKLHEYALALRDATAAHRLNRDNYKAPYRILACLKHLVDESTDFSVMEAAELLRRQSINIYSSQFTQPYQALGELVPNVASSAYSNTLMSKWLQQHEFVETLRYTQNRMDPVDDWNEFKNLGNRSCLNGQYKQAIEQYNTALQSMNSSSTTIKGSLIDLFIKRAEAALYYEAYDEALQDATTAIILNNQYVKGWGFRILSLRGIEKNLDYYESPYYIKI